MAINKVGSKGIQDGAVAQADFADNAVTSAKLEDGAVTNAKLTNTSVTLTGQSITLGDSVSFNNKFVDWQSVITADGSTGTTAVSGKGYFIDTTSAVHTLTLPASATIGDFIAIKDYAGTFNTNNLTIARNGHNIQGVANDSLISTNRASLVLVYVDSTKGWLYWEEHNVADLQGPTFITATGGTITTVGDYKVHAFTGDGCFVVSQIGNPLTPASIRDKVDYLVVAGGGSSGSRGGGGAGGARAGMSCRPAPATYIACGGLPVSATTYPITVGGGGSPTGSNSVFSTITSAGGGKGGNFGSPPGNVGTAGGSGGGGGAQLIPTPGPGGAGNTPPVSPPQGNPGASGSTDQATFTNGGGGGGWATAGTGSGGTSTGPKVGGAGHPVTVIFGCGPQPFYTPNPGDTGTGASETGYFSGGGGGHVEHTTPGSSTPYTYGGIGGGGRGTFCGGPNAQPSTSGTANTGGGGGSAAGAGGKGIVLIRYKFQ